MMLLPEGIKEDKVAYLINFLIFILLLCRGARVKAMAICTRHQYLHIYKVIRLHLKISLSSKP